MVDESREQEAWKQYPDYPFIEVSNLGRVRTKDRIITDRRGRKYHIKGRVLKQQRDQCGYMQVHFKVNGKSVCLYIHRMVAITFIPNQNGYPEVNHKDNNRANNNVSNLEWCTREYNNAYREKYGTACNHPVIAINPETGEVLRFESQSEATRKLGVSQGNISMVIKGKYDKTGGYWFCNADKNSVEKVRAKFGDEVAEKVKELMDKES